MRHRNNFSDRGQQQEHGVVRSISEQKHVVCDSITYFVPCALTS